MSKIVSAAGVAVIKRPGLPNLGNAIQRAMEAAILKAAEDGVTDSDQIRARMLEARNKVKSDFNILIDAASRVETEAAKHT